MHRLWAHARWTPLYLRMIYLNMSQLTISRDWLRDVHAVSVYRDLLQHHPVLGLLLHVLFLHDIAALGLLRQLVEHGGLHQVRLDQLHRPQRAHDQARRERELGGGVEDGDIFLWVKDRSGWTHVHGLGSLTFKVLCYEWVNSATKEENSVYSVMKWNMRGQLRSRTEAVTARARRQTPGQRQQETTIWCCLWTDVSLSPWPASRSRPMCQCQGTASDWSADEKHWPLIGRVRVSVSIRIIVHNVLLLSGLCIHPLRTKTISLKCKI